MIDNFQSSQSGAGLYCRIINYLLYFNDQCKIHLILNNTFPKLLSNHTVSSHSPIAVRHLNDPGASVAAIANEVTNFADAMTSGMRRSVRKHFRQLPTAEARQLATVGINAIKNSTRCNRLAVNCNSN